MTINFILILELSLIVCIFIACVSIIWYSVRLGISPMPSSRKACAAIISAGGDLPAGPIVDLGSGWGTLVFAVAKKYKKNQVIGFEKSFFPWLVSVSIKFIFNISNVKFYREDFLEADLSGASTLLCYLFPAGMYALEKKLEKDGGLPLLVISNTFAMPSWRGAVVVNIDDIYKTPIYIYKRFDDI